ncbi:hypothetical protein QM012_007303 [Aureobasidium pullulans]|uniref:TPX2 central domain-containing protein n=1 Tax=Aureobasidium pullulans TaxID=5580 RepID=A0ABR0TP19_AURPU
MKYPKTPLRRPPAALNPSSSSESSNGLEGPAPSFQAFIRRTPTPNQEKPLPPVPIANTPETSPISMRRSSSVYSRTVSQYAPTPESWRHEEHLMPTFFLQPSIYSLSTPELTLSDKPQSIIPPRPYAPLITSPSPSPSRTSTPSPPPDRFWQKKLPPTSPQMLCVATQNIRTVSLDKAKATLRSPGAQQLLPEELRALAAAKKVDQQHVIRGSKSFEGMMPWRTPVLSPVLPSPRLPSPTPFDWPLQANTDSDKHISKLSDEYFGMNDEKRMSMSPVGRQLKTSIEISVTRPSEPAITDYEPRGRSRQQSRAAPVKRLDNHKIKDIDAYQDRPLNASSNESLMNEAKRLANEYHALFKEDAKAAGFRKHSASSNSIKEKMKLVPQPLFFNPRQISKQRELEYQKTRDKAYSPAASRSPEPRTIPHWQRSSPKSKERPLNFPFKLSLTPESTGARRRRSTSGSIPISPPFPGREATKTKEPLSPVQRKQSIDDSNRFSAFYHRINADAEQLAREYNKPGNKVTFEMITLPTIFSHPSNETARSSQASPYGKRKQSYDSGISSVPSSKDSKIPLKSLTYKVTSVLSHHVRKSSVSAVEELSNLVENFKQRRPSFPIISAPQLISAAEAYDPFRLQASSPAASNIVKERPSVFAGIKHRRRESKANKRREELKKTIKMVPLEGAPQMSRRNGEWL